jgi:hypothetical protein
MSAPPSSDGALHDKDTELLPAAPLGAAGAEGVVRGVPGATSLTGLNPVEVTMRSAIEYVVPLVRPVIESGLTVEVGDRVDHDSPLLVEY